MRQDVVSRCKKCLVGSPLPQSRNQISHSEHFACLFGSPGRTRQVWTKGNLLNVLSPSGTQSKIWRLMVFVLSWHVAPCWRIFFLQKEFRLSEWLFSDCCLFKVADGARWTQPLLLSYTICFLIFLNYSFCRFLRFLNCTSTFTQLILTLFFHILFSIVSGVASFRTCCELIAVVLSAISVHSVYRHLLFHAAVNILESWHISKNA